MARFINDDIKLLHGGRRAVHITEDELQKRLWDFLYEREEIQDNYSYNPIPEKDDEVYIQLACCLYGDDMEKDLKYRNHCQLLTAKAVSLQKCGLTTLARKML